MLKVQNNTLSTDTKSGAAMRPKGMLLIIVLVMLTLAFPAECGAILINTKGQVVTGPFYLVDKPVPGWRFEDPKVRGGDQIAPNGKRYHLADLWFWSFDEDRLITQEKSLSGYVDMRGNLVIPAIYQEAGRFSNGFAIVRRSAKLPLK